MGDDAEDKGRDGTAKAEIQIGRYGRRGRDAVLDGDRDGQRRAPQTWHGSQSQTKVLVMAESSEVSVDAEQNWKHHAVNKKVGHIKMKVIRDLKSETIT